MSARRVPGRLDVVDGRLRDCSVRGADGGLVSQSGTTGCAVLLLDVMLSARPSPNRAGVFVARGDEYLTVSGRCDLGDSTVRLRRPAAEQRPEDPWTRSPAFAAVGRPDTPAGRRDQGRTTVPLQVTGGRQIRRLVLRPVTVAAIMTRIAATMMLMIHRIQSMPFVASTPSAAAT